MKGMDIRASSWSGFLVMVLFAGPECCFSADPLEETQSSFTYNGKPIHPGIIEQFSNWMSDPSTSQIIAIDLSTAQNSNRFDSASCIRDDNGWIHVKRSDPNDKTTFSYKFIGRLLSGSLVVDIVESGGGSGFFEDVMFFSLKREISIGDKGAVHIQHALRVLQVHALGDRVDASISLDGTRVRIDKLVEHRGSQRETQLLDDPMLLLEKAVKEQK
jgi:hypothetical protein